MLLPNLLERVYRSLGLSRDDMDLDVARGFMISSDVAHGLHPNYVNRSDIPGGSTVGSISSAMLPMRTMDIGLPLLAMHSAVETMGARDQEQLNHLMQHFLGDE